jgi:hypothetical protein
MRRFEYRIPVKAMMDLDGIKKWTNLLRGFSLNFASWKVVPYP